MSVFKKAEYLQVEGHTGLIRDSNSKAIISTDSVALREHRSRKEVLRSRINNIKNMNEININKINTLEKHVFELKELVNKLIENK